MIDYGLVKPIRMFRKSNNKRIRLSEDVSLENQISALIPQQPVEEVPMSIPLPPTIPNPDLTKISPNAEPADIIAIIPPIPRNTVNPVQPVESVKPINDDDDDDDEVIFAPLPPYVEPPTPNPTENDFDLWIAKLKTLAELIQSIMAVAGTLYTLWQTGLFNYTSNYLTNMLNTAKGYLNYYKNGVTALENAGLVKPDSVLRVVEKALDSMMVKGEQIIQEIKTLENAARDKVAEYFKNLGKKAPTSEAVNGVVGETTALANAMTTVNAGLATAGASWPAIAAVVTQILSVLGIVVGVAVGINELFKTKPSEPTIIPIAKPEEQEEKPKVIEPPPPYTPPVIDYNEAFLNLEKRIVSSWGDLSINAPPVSPYSTMNESQCKLYT